ncbi:MAG: 2OG-Fe(II) oxygenase [Alphaproteobacteria bacterium]|nr:2OG-Fe(II) oxygenase [Alphaproteobacteria bacterium]
MARPRPELITVSPVRVTRVLHPIEVPEVFTNSECQRIIATARAGQFQDAALVGGTHDDDTRRSRNYWLDDDGDGAWIFRRLLDAIAAENRNHFQFDLTDFLERMQVAWYGAETGGFFGWHTDCGGGRIAAQRKLTIVVQLSNADDYEGGSLETNFDGVVRAASRAIGSALILPSFVLHNVTPVTRGERYSLTLWSHGPAFR